MIKIQESNESNGNEKLSNEFIIQIFEKLGYTYKQTDDVYNLMFSKTIKNLYNHSVLISFYKDDVDEVYTLTLSVNAPIDYLYSSDSMTTKFELQEWLQNTYNVVLNEIKEKL